MGTPVLLTRARDGVVRAFVNICRHRQAPLADGCGAARRLVCPYHSWAYDLQGTVTGVPGEEGFAQARADGLKLTELPAAEEAGFLWVGLDPDADLDVAAHLGDLGPELASWDIGSWTPVGEKKLNTRIDWKLALDTFAENYHFATVHKDTFATVAMSNCTVFDSFGPHHRLVFPMLGIEESASVPEEEWVPLHKFVVIYALYPNVVLSVTPVNGEVFRVYPGDGPGHSITYHQNAAPIDAAKEGELEGAHAVFEYAHGTVRDEDYTLATRIQANLETGLLPELLFGRNEPGVQHRHDVLATALAGARAPS
jgi:phenylpropionate dioxygenase-like ring-hydroxylating dioxygenase large terminal subunit